MKGRGYSDFSILFVLKNVVIIAEHAIVLWCVDTKITSGSTETNDNLLSNVHRVCVNVA